MNKENKDTWRNRIVGYEEVRVDQLLHNEANWRIHPKVQQQALAGALNEVGLVQGILINLRTSEEWPPGQRNVETLIDGHLRAELAGRIGQPTLPAFKVDLPPNEERLVLATLDPLSALANADAYKLDELLREVQASDTALQELLADLSAQADAALAFVNAQDLADGAKDAVKKAAGDKRAAKVDLIFTLGAGGQSYVETRNGTSAQVICCVACKSGWLYGLRSSAGACAVSEIMLSHRVQFVDCLYTEYNHDLHLAQVAKHKPKYATVRDIMSKAQCEQAGIKYYPFDQIMKWAEELTQYAENVIVIPKYDCIEAIPPGFVLGYSIPTSHGGTPVPVDKFRGRRVHLLGGSPNKQIAYWAQLADEVVSLDNNYILKISAFGRAWYPDGTTKGLQEAGFGLVTNPLYIALAISLGNFAAYFNKSGDKDAQVQVEPTTWEVSNVDD